MSPAPAARLSWVDHARTLAIVLVVNLHACVTYSHVGGWYFKVPPEPTLAAKAPYIVWVAMLQSFFMGVLFFLAGFFAHSSLARRGPAAFARERLVRLGLPALLYMLVLHPFILLVLNPWNAKFGPPLHWYARYLTSGRFLEGSGPLWFAVALLLFSLVFAGLRGIRRDDRRPIPGRSDAAPAPSSLLLWGFAAVLGLATFAVRWVFPIGSSVLNLQLCFFVQYIAFFAAGIHASRHSWLESLASSRGARVAGWLALIGSPLLLLGLIWAGSGRDITPQHFFGGATWQAFGYAVWEQLTGVGLSLGLLALCCGKLRRETRWSRWLADRSFAVYVLHAPVLIALTLVFIGRPLNLPGSILLLTGATLLATFLAADLARRVPGLRSIL